MLMSTRKLMEMVLSKAQDTFSWRDDKVWMKFDEIVVDSGGATFKRNDKELYKIPVRSPVMLHLGDTLTIQLNAEIEVNLE